MEMIKYLFTILFLLLSTPTLSCEIAAPDWTGRVWARTNDCDIKKGNVTEIITGNSIWQVIGNVGRQIVPGIVWDGSEWYRDTNKDRVIWEGTAKQSSGPCYAGGKSSSGWEFSNGLRICR
jgi:hypothetical protein